MLHQPSQIHNLAGETSTQIGATGSGQVEQHEHTTPQTQAPGKDVQHQQSVAPIPGPPGASSNTGNSASTTAAAAILQNNGLRKSLQQNGSATGLRSLQSTMSTSNQLQIHTQQQQQQFLAETAAADAQNRPTPKTSSALLDTGAGAPAGRSATPPSTTKQPMRSESSRGQSRARQAADLQPAAGSVGIQQRLGIESSPPGPSPPYPAGSQPPVFNGPKLAHGTASNGSHKNDQIKGFEGGQIQIGSLAQTGGAGSFQKMMYNTSSAPTGGSLTSTGAIKPMHFEGALRDNFAGGMAQGVSGAAPEQRGSAQDPFKYQGVKSSSSGQPQADREWRKKPEFLIGSATAQSSSLNASAIQQNGETGGLFPQINSNGFKCNQPSSGQQLSAAQTSQPGSAHAASGGQGTMNALKHSGGHISGMSHHHHGLAGPNASGGLNGILNERHRHEAGLAGGLHQAPLKPMSSPRSSQQHAAAGLLGSLERPMPNSGNTSQNLADTHGMQSAFVKNWQQNKSQLTHQGSADGVREGQGARNVDSNMVLPHQPKLQSPQPHGPAAGGNAMLPQNAPPNQQEPLRAQMSSGSEKRLKLQTRQYYSDQYRVQQQRQHQQTANAVLSHGNNVIGVPGVAVGSSQIEMVRNANGQTRLTGGSTNGTAALDSHTKDSEALMAANYRVNMGMSGRGIAAGAQTSAGAAQAQAATTSLLEGQQRLNAYNTTSNMGAFAQNAHSNRQAKIHSSHQPTHVMQVMTPQIYSQQRQRGVGPNSGMNSAQPGQTGVLHNTQQISSQQMPIGSIMAPNSLSHHGSSQNGHQLIGGLQHGLHNAGSGPKPHSQVPQGHHQNLQQQQLLQNQMSVSQSYQPSGQQAQLANQNPMFFKKRASSNTNNNGVSSTQQQVHSAQAARRTNVNVSPTLRSSVPAPPANGISASNDRKHEEERRHISSPKATPPQSSTQIVPSQSSTQPTTTARPSQQNGSSGQSQSTTQSSATAGASNGQSQQQSSSSSQQQQQQPKIPVICGFHKRILLITCQNSQNSLQGNGQPGSGPGAGGVGAGGFNPNSSMSQARRIRNKNPNCNHNSNSVFYQPHYNNVKYDDSHKKKEDVLRKVFFKECAKEEEKRLYSIGGNGLGGPNLMFPNGHYGVTGLNGHHLYAGAQDLARQQALSQANDPNKHLQIIERILCEYLFAQLPFDRNQKQQLSNTQSLMMELGLDRALTPHRGFLLALIRAGKFNADNMLKVLSEVKTSATEFDNECIYCKYSQYALKESQKLLQRHQAALAEQAQTNPQQALLQQQQIQQNGGIIKGPSGEDIRIENLVRMFQSQLFKKSFINTSLMIIQRKMTEKYFQKYQNAKAAQQQAADGRGVQYGPDGKPIEGTRRIAKKPKPKNQANLSSLEYLSKEIQKLSKNLANPRDKERYLELKERYYREFLIKVLKSNGVEKVVFPTASFAPYKYYIGRGNNSGIVRTALKSRFWWSMGDYDDWEDYHFIWTQWKSNKILNCLKSWKEVQEQEQKDQDKKRSAQSTRGGHLDSQLSTQATDKESTSSKENLITTPKKNKLASASLAGNSDNQFKKQNTNTANSSAAKGNRLRGKKGDDKEEEKEENVTSHNHLYYSKMENNYHLSNKKAIFYNMKVYYEAIGKDYFKVLPLTFHIKEGLASDAQFAKFEQLFHDVQDPSKDTILDQMPKFGKSLWIVKPGENTNRGCGIQVSRDLEHIKNLVSNTNINGNRRSYIIQKYIEKPLLYKNRKFDIRCFTLMCTINGNLQGYWYQDGYLRTSCREFTLKNVSNRYVHLTNDAVQKKLDDYGKFESGNKLSYPEFQKYLDSVNIKCDFVKDVVPKMKQMVQDSMRAVSRKIDPNRRNNSFEIFGYDFMIDEDLNAWMIEVNTNPCFELSSPYLARLIPAMVENALKIAVDPIFPPPPLPPQKRHQCPDAMDNKFEMVFNERDDKHELKNLPIDDNMNGIIEEDEMEEEGSDIEEEEDHEH